jgi:hypothetical protein
MYVHVCQVRVCWRSRVADTFASAIVLLRTACQDEWRLQIESGDCNDSNLVVQLMMAAVSAAASASASVADDTTASATDASLMREAPAIANALSSIDGPYSFVVASTTDTQHQQVPDQLDADETRFWFGRDPLGRRSLLVRVEVPHCCDAAAAAADAAAADADASTSAIETTAFEQFLSQCSQELPGTSCAPSCIELPAGSVLAVASIADTSPLHCSSPSPSLLSNDAQPAVTTSGNWHEVAVGCIYGVQLLRNGRIRVIRAASYDGSLVAASRDTDPEHQPAPLVPFACRASHLVCDSHQMVCERVRVRVRLISTICYT